MNEPKHVYIDADPLSPAENLNIAYEQLINAVGQTMECAQKGNATQTEAGAVDIKNLAQVLRLKGHAAGKSMDLKTILESFPVIEVVPKGPRSPSMALVLQYAAEPESFVAVAYLNRAETKLKDGDLTEARAAYAKIAPWEDLRKYLDDPVLDNDCTLTERLQTLDMDPLFSEEVFQ